MPAQTNTFAEVVQGWVNQSFRSSPAFVRRLRQDGEFEAVVRAPRGSKAGCLTIFTSHGNLWVRFNPPNMCYPIESRSELALVVRQLVAARAFFVVTYRDAVWRGTTLLRKGMVPKVSRGEVAHLTSWTARFDRILGQTS